LRFFFLKKKVKVNMIIDVTKNINHII